MIPSDDLKVEVWPKRAIGGQQVNISPTAVKVTHLPTNTQAICEIARSQHKNRAIAISMIEAALTHP